MKTKTNKVPLVGPRGRKELLKKINELEEHIGNSGSDDVKKNQSRPNSY